MAVTPIKMMSCVSQQDVGQQWDTRDTPLDFVGQRDTDTKPAVFVQIIFNSEPTRAARLRLSNLPYP